MDVSRHYASDRNAVCVSLKDVVAREHAPRQRAGVQIPSTDDSYKLSFQ